MKKYLPNLISGIVGGIVVACIFLLIGTPPQKFGAVTTNLTLNDIDSQIYPRLEKLDSDQAFNKQDNLRLDAKLDTLQALICQLDTGNKVCP